MSQIDTDQHKQQSETNNNGVGGTPRPLKKKLKPNGSVDRDEEEKGGDDEGDLFEDCISGDNIMLGKILEGVKLMSKEFKEMRAEVRGEISDKETIDSVVKNVKKEISSGFFHLRCSQQRSGVSRPTYLQG